MGKFIKMDYGMYGYNSCEDWKGLTIFYIFKKEKLLKLLKSDDTDKELIKIYTTHKEVLSHDFIVQIGVIGEHTEIKGFDTLKDAKKSIQEKMFMEAI